MTLRRGARRLMRLQSFAFEDRRGMLTRELGSRQFLWSMPTAAPALADISPGEDAPWAGVRCARDKHKDVEQRKADNDSPRANTGDAHGVGRRPVQMNDVLKDADNKLGGMARMSLQQAAMRWPDLKQHIAWRDERVPEHPRNHPEVQRAAQLVGVGPVTASATMAGVGDLRLCGVAALVPVSVRLRKPTAAAMIHADRHVPGRDWRPSRGENPLEATHGKVVRHLPLGPARDALCG